MSLKIVLFNGPPRSGKDTAADFVADNIHGQRMAFAEPLKRAICALFGFNPERWRHYDQFKDKKDPAFFGQDLRQLQIRISEEYLKPICGRDIFAKIFLRILMSAPTNGMPIFVSDCGFQEELDFLAAQPDVKVALIHIIRPGHDFNGDSRGYVQPRDGMYFGVINNDQDLIWLQEQALDQVNMFLLASK